ncbi:MAG TPA: hypothetical protein VNT26_08125, partial [Candidatus Sulfotelmatobacter sp.]|nr:hypothetical protein [Candidatus Sulfotelmatobacter sp.]
MKPWFLPFGIPPFEIVSDFEFRISNFLPKAADRLLPLPQSSACACISNSGYFRTVVCSVSQWVSTQ